MKLPRTNPRSLFRSFVSPACFATLLATTAAHLRAADLTWDASASAGVQSTAGTWNNQTTSNWTADGGASNVQWNNAALDNAFFTTSNTLYTVTLATVAANNVTFSGGGTAQTTLSGTSLTFGGTLTVAAGNTVGISSQLTGAGAIVNNGTLTVNSALNNFSGGLTLNTGSVTTVSVNNAGTIFGTGVLTLNGGTMNVNLFGTSATLPNVVFGGDFTFNVTTGGNFGGTVDLGGATRTITSTGASNVGFGGAISNGGIIVAGSRGVTLNNANSTFAGGVTVSSGSTLNVGGTTYTGTPGAVTAGSLGTGTLTLQNGAIITGNNALTANNVSVLGDFSMNGTSFTLAGPIDLNGGNRTLTVLGTTSSTISGKISNGGIILAGTTGNVTFNNIASDFSGGLTIGANNAITIVNASTGTANNVTSGPIGTGTLTINGGSISTSNASNIYNSIVVGGDFSMTPNTGSTIYGTMSLGSAIRSLNVHSSFVSNTLRLGNVISGTGGLTFTATRSGGANTWTSTISLEGAVSNTYTGLTTLAATAAPGVLSLAKTSGAIAIAGDLLVTNGTVSYAQGNQIADTSAVTLNGSAAVLNLGASRSDTVGTVTVDGGGSITGTGTSTLTSTSGFEMKNGSVTAILGGAGIALNKTTSGTVTLSGVNTFTGATSVGEGTLALASTGTLASTAYTIGAGATLDLSSKTSYSLSQVATTLDVGATTAGFVNGPTGALTLGNALMLNFSTGLIADGQTYNLFDFGSKLGNFSSVNLTGSIIGSLLLTDTDLWTGSAGGYAFSFNQATGGLLVTGSAIPEPSTYAILAGCLGLAAALAVRRRRR